MTAQAELTLLEGYYAGWIAAGMPTSYSIDGRSFSRPAMESIVKRIDQLRFAVGRQQNGNVLVAQFREAE